MTYIEENSGDTRDDIQLKLERGTLEEVCKQLAESGQTRTGFHSGLLKPFMWSRRTIGIGSHSVEIFSKHVFGKYLYFCWLLSNKS